MAVALSPLADRRTVGLFRREAWSVDQMRGPEREQLLAGVGEKTIELAGTSPTSAMVGAALAYVGVRIVRRDDGNPA